MAHKRDGLKAGMDPEVVAAIAARAVRPALKDAQERAVYDVATTLLATHAPCRPRCMPAQRRRWASAGLVELVGLLGYYSMVALTLNAFEIGLPEGAQPELQDPDFPA
jgi:4-carboxymuconolactone decarboxylase